MEYIVTNSITHYSIGAGRQLYHVYHATQLAELEVAGSSAGPR